MIDKAIEFLVGKTFFVATIKDGMPTMRPFGAVMKFENKLYFSTSNSKDVYKQIMACPNVCISACGENRNWLRIHGKACIDNRIIAKQAMLDSNPVLLTRKRFASANDPTMVVFYLDEIQVEFN